MTVDTEQEEKQLVWVMIYTSILMLNQQLFCGGWFIVFNATFNNISVISWQSILLVEETGIPAENHRPVASH